MREWKIENEKHQCQELELQSRMCRLDILSRVMKEKSTSAIPVFLMIKTNDIRKYFEL